MNYTTVNQYVGILFQLYALTSTPGRIALREIMGQYDYFTVPYIAM